MPLLWLVLLAIMSLLCGCVATRYVETVGVRTDTVYMSRLHRDSIYIKDSVSVIVRNDTVWRDRWHTKVIDKSRIDTIRETRTDSVFVERGVEKKLSFGQRAGLFAGTIIPPLLVLSFIIYIMVRKFL